MKYTELAEGNFMSSGALDIEDKDIRLVVEYRNGNILFLVSTIYYEGRSINYLTPATFLKNIDSDIAKNNIERIKSMMISVGNDKMSLKDFLKEVPQFKLYINDDGNISSF
jgi:hypothetical protein